MTILKVIQQGFSQVWQYKRIIGLLYGLTLLLAGVVALPLQSLLESKVGHSLMVDEMMKGFNYTFYTDFMNAYGDGFAPIVNQSLLILFLYVLLFVFLMGGIISTFQNAPKIYHKAIFWGKSAGYFWRMLRLTFYFLIIHGVVLGFFLWLFMKFTKGFAIAELETDEVVFSTLTYLPIAYVIVSAFFYMWHDYAKVILVQENTKWVYQPILSSLRFITKHIAQTYPLYLLNMALLGLVFLINYWVTTSFLVHSTSAVWVSLLITQVFVIIRLGLKLLNLSSANVLFTNL